MERLAEGFEGFGARQTAGLNALQNRWSWLVAARVAFERPREGLKARQTAGLNGLKNRFAFERPAGGFEGFVARQMAGLNALKNRWPWRWRVAARVAFERPAGGFEGLKGLGPGKRQA